MTSWQADRVRTTFTRYFVERGHTSVPSSGLIPHDPRAPLFTNAGMNQFIPYFLGEQPAPYPRATSVQKCARIRGKHDDIELIGRTTRHLTFFEMLGNFSFGDYFKPGAIAYAWELLTDGFGLDPDQLWVTVHDSDDDAEEIWRDEIGVAGTRIQRMGEDNFWEMGDTGPCGPCSEIYIDRGAAWGEEGGPAHGGEERFVELWNLVFMQYDRQDDGTLLALPKPNIDTGAGLERVLMVLQDQRSVWETDEIRTLIASAEELTGARYGVEPETDVALRIVADHARSVAFLISDGVFPSNESRGYVLRRLIRRAVLRAQQQLGHALETMAPLADAVVRTMGGAYPKLVTDAGLIGRVVTHEEDAFRRTLRAGSALLDEHLQSGAAQVPGEVAFRLHDTYGFPIELTSEIAAARGVAVDRGGFEAEMEAQRSRARAAARHGREGDDAGALWRDLLEEFGPTTFLGYETTEATARVLAVLSHAGPRPDGDEGGPEEGETGAFELYDVVLDATPFYAEGGGQVGDTGEFLSGDGRFVVLDTNRAIEGLTRHVGYFVGPGFEEGDEVVAAVDAERREAIRRNHTGTHLLHWALRAVLGEHVKQQGSLVAPDRLRFDFSHFGALTREEIVAVEDLVNAEVLSDATVHTEETSRHAAEEAGAIAFFGDKYGERVRVVHAGHASVELCGGTHVSSLGHIGPFRIVAESSIGANTRRIEATTGMRTFEEIRRVDDVVARASAALRTSPGELVEAAERIVDQQRALEEQLRSLRAARLRDDAARLAARADRGVVTARVDGLDPGELRDLALAIREQPGVDAVGLAGTPGAGRVALVVATMKGGQDARAIAGDAAAAVGGGGGGSPELATAGGRDVAAIDVALTRLRAGLVGE